jgi:hypothetical protein
VFRAVPACLTWQPLCSLLLLGGTLRCLSQFHPEKSGTTGLTILSSFLDPQGAQASTSQQQQQEQQHGSPSSNGVAHGLAKRVIACLDVRSNDQGDLVVTKVSRAGEICRQAACPMSNHLWVLASYSITSF